MKSKSGFSVDGDFSLLEISSVVFVQKHQVDPVLYGKSVVNIFVRGRQLDTVHVHSDWDNLTLVRTAIHHFILDQSISLG